MNEKIKEKLKIKIAISQMQEKEKITIKENEKNQKFKICKNTREGEKDEMNKKEKFVIKNIGIAVCTLMSLSGVVFAGNKVIETIWKEPEKIKFSEEITEEVRRENISKQEAEQKAVEMLEKFCFSTNIIKTKEMKDPISDEITYVFYTDDEYEVQITGRDGISYTITDNKIRKKDDSKKITEEEAKKMAEEYCNKYGINLQEYELTQIWSNNPEGSGKGDGNNICMTYSKKYDGITNPYQGVGLTIQADDINRIGMFRVYEKPFEDNEIKIGEEEAKQIAVMTDKKITSDEIINIEAKKMIVKMNADAYERINNIEEYYKSKKAGYKDKQYYSVDDKIRKAWVVTISYKDTYGDDIQKRYTQSKYSYFIDGTTGEIIGGHIMNYTFGE